MESLILISCFILLVITGFYAWFTYRMLQVVRQENTFYKSILDRQLKVSVFPHIHCDMQCNPQLGEMKLEVYNIGNTPAYDILVSVIGAYTEENMDIPAFMRNYVQPRYRKYPLQVDKVGYYGIRSSNRASILPAQRQFSVGVKLPILPVDIYALIQYREILGSNYYQVYCFSDLDEKGNYRANILEPQSFEALERLHFYDVEDTNLAAAEKALPYYVGDFIDLWNHSMSCRLTTLYVEDAASPPALHDAP